MPRRWEPEVVLVVASLLLVAHYPPSKHVERRDAINALRKTIMHQRATRSIALSCGIHIISANSGNSFNVSHKDTASRCEDMTDRRDATPNLSGENIETIPITATTTQQPIEQLEVQTGSTEDDTVYPNGLKLWLAFLSLCMVSVLYGLNLAIVAATIPSLTDHFKRINDIGWYSSAYTLMIASFTVTYGKLYSQTSAKRVYLISITIFQLGSLLCTVAQSSLMFIFGRAVVGIGAAGVGSGSYIILSRLFPPNKRPLWITVMGSTQMVGIVSAPLLGGVLIDWIGWRGCFGFSIPLGVVAIGFVWFAYDDTTLHEDDTFRVSLWDKVQRFDWLSTFLMLPSFSCLLLALQWGGIRYAWRDARVLVPLSLFGILILAFGYRQHRLKESATLPLRIIKTRTMLAACWFSSCVNTTLTITEYYMSIYFQGVMGYSATQSGIRMTPLLVCITIGSLGGGFGVKWLGYYNPFMIATTVLAPVASGLLTTIRLDDSEVKVLCLLGFLGLAVGVGLQGPVMALQTTMNKRDLPIAISASVLSSTLGSSVWVVASTSLFTSRLKHEMAIYSPSTNFTQIVDAGLSDIRTIVGQARLRNVLLGYDEAVTQTLYLPLGLTVATLIGSALIEWRSVKQKQV